MGTKNLLKTLSLFLYLFSFASCNKDEPKFSASEIQQALFDMKGTYHGTVEVSYYHGSSITKLNDAIAVSRDSLSFTMSLLPIAELITEESVAGLLRETGEIIVKAGYEFYQMEQGNINFALSPKEVVIPGGYGTPPTVKIVFAQTFGGDAEIWHNFIMFNISPVEVWLNGEKQEDFKQLVYHFRGFYE